MIKNKLWRGTAVPVFPRRGTHVFAENVVEILRGAVSAFRRDFLNRHTGSQKHIAGVAQTDPVEIRIEVHAEGLLEKYAQMPNGNMQRLRNPGKRQIRMVFCVQNLRHGLHQLGCTGRGGRFRFCVRTDCCNQQAVQQRGNHHIPERPIGGFGFGLQKTARLLTVKPQKS